MRNRLILSFLLGLAATGARGGAACIGAPYQAGGTEAQAELVEIVGEVRPVLDRFGDLGAVLERETPEICFASRIGPALGYLEADIGRIVLSRAQPRPLQAGIFLHELRHLWQFSRGSCPRDALSMKEYGRATFAIEADASAVSLLLAWDMKAHGDPSVWEALAAWPSHQDIAARFAETMEETGDGPRATTAAFYQWYASPERRERYYRAACSDYLDRQDRSHLIPRYQAIGAEFFESLCRMPDGGVYSCADPEAGAGE